MESDAEKVARLPEWYECEQAVGYDGCATPLQSFIYDHEPADSAEAEKFRAQLAAAITAAKQEQREADAEIAERFKVQGTSRLVTIRAQYLTAESIAAAIREGENR